MMKTCAMTTAVTEESVFIMFANVLQGVVTDIGLFNGCLEESLELLAALSDDDAANTIISLKDIGEAIKNAAIGEGGMKLLAQQILFGFCQTMQQTVKQNLTLFKDISSSIVLEGSSLTQNLRDNIQKINLSKFDEALKIVLEQYLTLFHDEIVTRIKDNFSGSMDRFKDFIEIMEKAKLKVIELHYTIAIRHRVIRQLSSIS